MTGILFHPDVRMDINESYSFYENQSQGLGDDFLIELEQAYHAILDLPVVWPLFAKGFRRYFLSRFPFAIVYKVETRAIYVVAVMHQSRKPNYWVERL
jgi:toxin ParE1/3/4